MRQHASLDWPERMRQLGQQAQYPALQQFYQGTQLDPERPLCEQPLMALDLETSGLNSEQEHILSVGIQPFNLERIPVGQRQHWLVRSPRPVSEGAVTIHQITDSALASAPELSEVLAQVISQMTGHLMVVHYRNIERGFLNRASEQLWQEPWLFPVIDTMALEALVYRKRTWWQQLLRQRAQGPSIRLADARARLGLPFYSAHAAHIDALATAELLQAQVAHRYRPDTPIGQLWS